ncbi:MAG: glycosyltransferase family 4 protein [Acidiferrobacterales bacterium]
MTAHNTIVSKPEWAEFKSIVLIGNYLPRQCGIATFTTHLLESIALNAPDKTSCWAVAMNDRPDGYPYPSHVRVEIDQSQLSEYSLAADLLNHNQVDVVCLQHEFGIFGGKRGSFIIELLRELKMPIITTLHTILSDPSARERNVIMELASLSDRLVVMSERSIDFLHDIYTVPKRKIVLIDHGIPDVPLTEVDVYQEKFGVSGKKVILTFGLLGPDKGLETVIDALPKIINTHPEIIFMIVGATHPHHKAEHGEAYRISLNLQAKNLGVADHVIFHDRFVSEDELSEFVGAADIYITPYLNEAQIISGTLSYALGMGKATISTPYWHAQELLADGRGILIPFQDHEVLAREVIRLLDNPDELRAMRERAWEYGRKMVWRNVGARYLDLFTEARHRWLRNDVTTTEDITPGSRPQSLPEIKLDHLFHMTDGTGILQHAKHSIPNRQHGYCVDDNARALIVAIMVQDLHPLKSSMTDLITVYLSFLDYAFNNGNGRFRNFLSYDRCWLEEAGSEDSYGRALWALGITVALGRNKGHVALATDLLQQTLKSVEQFASPRAIAFTIIATHAYLSRNEDDHQVEDLCKRLSQRLINWFDASATEDWPWFEDSLTYDNARLSQALLLSGRRFDDNEMMETGLRSLSWLQKIQTDETSHHFSAIGNDGWYKRNGKRAQFDQQPIEAAAMVDASMEAFKCTLDKNWIDVAYQCLNWYLGDNDIQTPLYDHSTGGCRDGLEADGVNENQGAESSLCWLTALLAIYNHRGRS